MSYRFIEIPNYKCLTVTMNTSSRLLHGIFSLLVISAVPLSAVALEVDPPAQAPATPPALDHPPQMEPLDEGEPALTNLRKSSVKQTVQTTQNGEQTEVKVTNSVGTYIVKPNQNVGTSLPGDGQSNSNNPVQWVIKSWGGSKNTDVPEEVPPTLPVNPNPPASK